MHTHTYTFKVGTIECAVLLDGATLLGAAGIVRRFPAATEEAYRQAYAELELSLDAADSSFNILLARIGDQMMLVDAGEGGNPKGGYLPERLRQAGVKPEAVTLVIITHTHGDHVLGLLTANQQPVFPHATYGISKEEMAFWQHRIDAGTADHHPIVAMIEAQGLHVIDMDEQIVPGMCAVPLPGHTPGRIGVMIESEGEHLIHMADLVHSPMQFAHPEWSPSFDLDTSVSVPTRWAALERAADANMLALFYHLTFPGLGRIERTVTGFRWRPITP